MSLNQLAVTLVVGTLPLLVLPRIPDTGTLMLLLPLLLLVRTRFYVVGLVAVGVFWSSYSARMTLGQIDAFSVKPVTAQVSISSMRFAKAGIETPEVRVWQVNQRWIFPPLYVRLNAMPPMTDWCGGQQWQMRLRLRPAHSRLNEGGFDRQRWALAHRQLFTGRVLSAEVVSADCSLRQRLIARIEQQTASLPWRSILLALAVGEMATLADETRILLQHTGTMHLMVISGLHVALAALFGWGIARAIQYSFPPRWVGYRFPLTFGWLVAWGYVALAGANPPAVRAALALSVWTLLRLRGISCSPWQVWLWCVALILFSDPLSILSDSFWLSCLAVASLIFWYQWAPLPIRFQRDKRWFLLRWLHLQWGITLLLLPLQIVLFHGMSLTSLPANLWAVPLVSFISTPLILLALPLTGVLDIGAGVWWLADRSLALVFAPLTVVQDGWWDRGADFLAFSAFGWGAVIIWRFAWWRQYPVSIGALLLFVLVRPKPPSPDWRVDMLDVGHGLAVVIERQGKAILYDTGNRWEGGDMVSREILPYLKWRGLQLEKIIISHSHLDHIGGLQTLQRIFPTIPVYSPLRQHNHLPCVRGQQWRWQTLTFSVLWPPSRVQSAGNNDSCVVRIDDGRHRVLLTGDLEAEAEAELLKNQRTLLAAEVLQAPHHGSSTSSSPPFIRAVGATTILASAARYSPWRLPSAKIVRRYRDYGYQWADTATFGQLSVRFFNDSWRILRYRRDISPRWFHRWFGGSRDNE
ncbi:ComEC family protein [Prodigiosinella confusarubida]|uniref:ComEC family protein n=1 Tax=Serratia sp. (strain ATCC 39006) TaxID=104623 RepID=A0A2I5TLJ8_SERS3|nr:ComEC family protein [Serratia sp. ATCC 39006]AUH01113.1 ComEC family protein [Serratia sp. ATCC 39006]AUH05434.1 ComEC family protein [Serratia sp. ATCC 39006]